MSVNFFKGTIGRPDNVLGTPIFLVIARSGHRRPRTNSTSLDGSSARWHSRDTFTAQYYIVRPMRWNLHNFFLLAGRFAQKGHPSNAAWPTIILPRPHNSWDLAFAVEMSRKHLERAFNHLSAAPYPHLIIVHASILRPVTVININQRVSLRSRKNPNCYIQCNSQLCMKCIWFRK